MTEQEDERDRNDLAARQIATIVRLREDGTAERLSM
jgi:hypothetical protein